MFAYLPIFFWHYKWKMFQTSQNIWTLSAISNVCLTATKHLQVWILSFEFHIYWKWGVCHALTNVVNIIRIPCISPIWGIITLIVSLVRLISHRYWLQNQSFEFIIIYKSCWKYLSFDFFFVNILSTPTPIRKSITIYKIRFYILLDHKVKFMIPKTKPFDSETKMTSQKIEMI